VHGRFRIEGYAIASADGMIADWTGFMPDSLKIEADLRFLDEALDRADVVVNGRLSYEDQPNSPRRRRLIPTRHVAGLAPDPDNPKAWLWNPAGASLEEACAAVGCRAGAVAVIGGPFVFSLFLEIGYDRFYLNRAVKVKLPGGIPVFEEQRRGLTPEQVLSGAGLEAAPPQWLDDEVALVEWVSRAELRNRRDDGVGAGPGAMTARKAAAAR